MARPISAMFASISGDSVSPHKRHDGGDFSIAILGAPLTGPSMGRAWLGENRQSVPFLPSHINSAGDQSGAVVI